ncbi:MAG: ATP-binding cassette domain-containing protein [Lactobacillus sp.]|jgi:pleuromutilin/lincosamide/streptogramin A transport system ATP-binding/permease protein|nr:ATP-binding cassette domain-containing protein [Lactobacillus sp.]
MSYYQAKDLTQTIGAQNLFHIKQLGFHSGDRIGIVGPNGAGKTTLLKLLSDPHHSPIVPSASKYLVPQIKASEALSGGEIVQRYLDLAFASQAELLFLDEPTANLDTANIESLEAKLTNYPGTLILISHDRAFLDHIATTIWALDGGQLQRYKGNYSAYQSQLKQAQQHQWHAYEQYETKKLQLEKAAAKRQVKANRAAKIPQNKLDSQEAYKAKPYFHKKEAKLAKTAKAIEKRATQLTAVAKPEMQKPIKMALNNETALQRGTLLQIKDFDLYQGQQLLLQDVTVKVRGGDKLALTGPNGSGKTTLIQAILTQKSPAIFVNPAAKIGYFQQDLNNLDLSKSVYANVLATAYQDETTIKTVLARLGFKNEALAKQVGVLSGGERVKVSFAKLFVSAANCLILDEPTNFLDIVALEALQQLLVTYRGTVVLISHDRYFVKAIAQRYLQIDPQAKRLFDPKENRPNPIGKPDVAQNKAEDLLRLQNRQAQLLNALTQEPDNADFNQEFLAVSRQIRALQ